MAVFTCCQTSEVGSTREIECVVLAVSVLANDDPSVTMYCSPNVSGVSVSG